MLNIKKEIVFYNNFHYGDLHFSRGFILDIYNKLNKKFYKKFYYYHSLPNDIFFDYIFFDKFKGRIPDINSQIVERDNVVFINTWIGQENRKYVTVGISLYSSMLMFKKIYSKLKIKLESIENYVPTIDFSKLNYLYVKNINNFIENNKKKIVLISNGSVHSCQSQNFNFEPIITYLANKNKNVIFICTWKNCISDLQNMLFTCDIIGKPINDLNEISYLSLFCDIIVGRASGPYCFTQIKENINNKNKTFISFSNNQNDGIWFQSKAKNVWSNNYNIDNIINIINKEI